MASEEGLRAGESHYEWQEFNKDEWFYLQDGRIVAKAYGNSDNSRWNTQLKGFLPCENWNTECGAKSFIEKQF